MAAANPIIQPVPQETRNQPQTLAKVRIRTRDLWKIYNLGEVKVQALRGVSLDIEDGSFVAIMGSSGSGKSTMLNIIGCLDRPTSGQYLLDGIDVSTYSAAMRADIRNEKIGFVFQNFNLLPRSSVWENVEAPMLYAGISRAERSRRVEEALEIVRIPEKAKAFPNQLSGGQQQRVAIARAIINQPAILLADEPTGNLDSVTSKELLVFMRELNQTKGLTLVMVTHDDEAAMYATRLIVMRDGRIESDREQG
jgi:putative ABC transport system ATP-binding protein